MFLGRNRPTVGARVAREAAVEAPLVVVDAAGAAAGLELAEAAELAAPRAPLPDPRPRFIMVRVLGSNCWRDGDDCNRLLKSLSDSDAVNFGGLNYTFWWGQ